jgi:hypothetical protein
MAMVLLVPSRISVMRKPRDGQVWWRPNMPRLALLLVCRSMESPLQYM